VNKEREDRTHWIPEDWLDSMGLNEEDIGDSRSNWKHFTPEFVGTKTQTLNLNALYSEMGAAQRRFTEARISQPEGLVRLDTEYPVSIFFIGDVHFGSIYTDHRRFLKEIQQIADTPNAYIAFMSNLIDNAIPSQYPSNMLANSIPPDKQVVAMRRIVQELDEQGKVLAAVTSDCHEGWTWKHAGQDINALIFGFEGRSFPVLENGGRLVVRMGRAKYTIGLYHKIGPFRSNFNYTHGLKQMNRLKQNMECDVVAGAHYHCGSTEEVFEGTGKHLRLNVYVQSGTYKGIGQIHDQWVQAKYGSTGQPSAQQVELWPNKRKLCGHTEFETGLLAHEAYLIREMVK